MNADDLLSIFEKFPVLMKAADPWGQLGLFLAASAMMIWRLDALEKRGFEGTVLGTLIMPYCSGISNLIFAFVMGKTGGNGTLVLENCLVNNVTNITLLLGLPAMIWTLNTRPGERRTGARKLSEKIQRIDRLSLLLTLLAMLFFSGVLWALAADGQLNFADGLVLAGVFLFWQIFQVFEVLKDNVRLERSFSKLIFLELAVILACGYGVYISIEALVHWVETAGSGWIVIGNIGWLSGLLMVVPNALLAFYYAGKGRSDVVVSSQIGDGHICIPMSVGLFALFSPIRTVAYFKPAVIVLLAAGVVHFLFIAIRGRLPRWLGGFLVAAYFIFLYRGILG